MKAEVKEIDATEFPVLMQLGGDVVMFIDCDRGTLVASESRPEDIGEYSNDWIAGNFKPFHGSITLSND